MTADKLVHECQIRGAILRRHPNGLGITGYDQLSRELLDQLRRQKAEVLEILDEQHRPALVSTARQVLDGEFDGGSPALLRRVLAGLAATRHPALARARARLVSMLEGGQ